MIYDLCARHCSYSVCVRARLCATQGISPSAYILMNLCSANIIFTVNEADSLKRQHKVLI